ncbi:hypothetical protein BN2156_02611 [Mycolicibacterium neworleansense]|uniref:Uncharacterized protein n=1 Tax=Mycolicibacterium neworleansense TaxID=146018 RepID=A0A0H5RP70_9MYCO|nr:hypothetical protein BN2156_02611 [Mycolicibacterium neworleansense]
MTAPVYDDFTVPVVLQGVDSTRVWRSRARQTLTMSPAGITFERRGKTVQFGWRDITGITMRNMSGSIRITFNAWAICAPGAEPIYPHEFEKRWPTGQIGRWLAHYRPDLVLPADGAMLPFGMPRDAAFHVASAASDRRVRLRHRHAGLAARDRIPVAHAGWRDAALARVRLPLPTDRIWLRFSTCRAVSRQPASRLAHSTCLVDSRPNLP